MDAKEVITKVSTCFQCECNGKMYDSRTKLKQHQKSQSHVAWHTARELRELKITLTRRDNEILKLTTENTFLKEWTEGLIRGASCKETVQFKKHSET